MITKCKFNKNRDIQETVPGLEVSIEEALVSGVIKSTGTSTPYNEMESTEQVGNYLHDAIDIAMEARRVGEFFNALNTPVAGSSSIEENTK